MMSGLSIRLRVDSPYPGESMSSFLGRAAQFYAMPTRELLSQLMMGAPWKTSGRSDLDLEPPPILEHLLAECVRGWQSPLRDHRGFMSWTLAPIRRTAYCPRCFEADLAAGRTPFFRNDWIPVFVTTCWEHGMPLFDWTTDAGATRRRFPKGWLYQSGTLIEEAPELFLNHLEQCRRLEQLKEENADDLLILDALRLLKCLQSAVEKQSAEPAENSSPSSRDLVELKSIARLLVMNGARHSKRGREDPVAAIAGAKLPLGLFEPIPDGMRRHEWEFSESAIRKTKRIGWRRTYLFFAARTLAGTRRFGQLFCYGDSPPQPWEVWWRELFTAMGSEQQSTLSWLFDLLRKEFEVAVGFKLSQQNDEARNDSGAAALF